jgi:hypothetical protein
VRFPVLTSSSRFFVALTLAQERPRDGTEVDRALLKFLLSFPESGRDFEETTTLLDADISRSRFNSERAEQVFLFLIDTVVASYARRMGLDVNRVLPNSIRLWSAKQMAEDYVESRGRIHDQRPARRGLLALLLGK